MNKYLILLLPTLLQVIDIFPGTILLFSALILGVGIHLVVNLKFNFNRGIVLKGVSWYVLSMLMIGASLAMMHLDPTYGYYNYEKSLSYMVRVSFVFITFLFLFFVIYKQEFDSHDFLMRFSYFLFGLILFSAIFEFLAKTWGFNDLLYLYKARQDLGGIDTIHYNRLSGFYSFPGDIAAVIVLNFVLVKNYVKKYKILMLTILLVFLLLTQSKAGLVLLLSYLFFSMMTNGSYKLYLGILMSLALIYLVIIFFKEYFVYYFQFFNQLDFYLESSKRAQEILSYFSLDFFGLAIGNPVLDKTYETELFGSLNRVGFIGSFWFLSVLFLIPIIYFKRKFKFDIFLILILFLVVYCSISAGFGRFKILLPYMIVFIAALLHQPPNHFFKKIKKVNFCRR